MTQPTNEKGMNFTQYRRTAIAEMVPWGEDVDMSRVSVSASDRESGSPKRGDMIARNPANHDDQWLVAAAYFAANFEPLAAAPRALPADDVGEVKSQLAAKHRELCAAAVKELNPIDGRMFNEISVVMLNAMQTIDRLTAALADEREKFTMHTAHVHAWFSALVQELGIAGEGQQIDVATACSKAMDAVARRKEALTEIKAICERPHLDPFQVPIHTYQTATCQAYHEIKNIAARALERSR